MRSAETGKAAEVPAKAVQEMKDFLRSKLVADIDFTGTVQDTDGNPVDGVRMLVVVGDRKGKRYEEPTVSRTFTLKYADTVLCDVYFSKAGYYKEKRRFNTSSGLGVTGASADGDALIAPVGFVVAMESVGPATRMFKFEPMYEFRVAGEWRVDQLATEKDGKRELLRKSVYTRLDMTGKGVDALPPYCPYVRADVENGKIVLAEKWVMKTYPGGAWAWIPPRPPRGCTWASPGRATGCSSIPPSSARYILPSGSSPTAAATYARWSDVPGTWGTGDRAGCACRKGRVDLRS